MKLLSSGGTDPGKKRKNNEDAFVLDNALGLYVVADGIGGNEAGEVASRIVADTLVEVVSGLMRKNDTTPPYGLSREAEQEASALRYAVTLSNRTIYERAARDPSLAGMGTTATALLLRRGKAFIAHVGDSRAYLLRGGALKQVTNDHSIIAEHIRAGRLTPKQALTSPYRHVITRAVGIDREVAVDQTALEVKKDDLFLLCTDGLTELVDDAGLANILSLASPQKAAAELIRAANDRGGVDNITAVVIKVEEM